jgi:hypothetical protein
MNCTAGGNSPGVAPVSLGYQRDHRLVCWKFSNPYAESGDLTIAECR